MQNTGTFRDFSNGNRTMRHLKVGAGAVLPTGCGVVVHVAGANAGYAFPASDSATAIKTMGVAFGDPSNGADVTNATGANGAQIVTVALNEPGGHCGPWKNSATNPITQAQVGRVCFWEDNDTVTLNGTNDRQAGLVVKIAADGIFLDLTQTANTPTA
jgi:hypothetical protein